MHNIFDLKNIGFSYLKNKPALENVNLSVLNGEILSIIGTNGSGKSTLLHILSGLLYPTQGNISFLGNEFNEKSFRDHDFNVKFRSSVGFIFQNSDAQLFCPTVFDELLFGPLQLGLNKEMAFERAQGVMQMLNIEYLKDRPVYMLSGGEKKRVAIGATLTTNPNVLLMDEPLSGLDPKTRSSIIDLILKLNEVGKTIIITTHNLELVEHLQSRVAVMGENHSIVRTGEADEILSDINYLVCQNLINEPPHRHGKTIHKHQPTAFLFHRHFH